MVRDGKDRSEIFLEGGRLCREAIESNIPITQGFYETRFAEQQRGAEMISTLNSQGVELFETNARAFASLADTESPQGLILLAQRPNYSADNLAVADRPPLLVIAHRLNNPSNAGAIMRTAEAAGATGIITTNATTDLYSTKSVRASMGSALRLPIWQGAGFEEALAFCQSRSIQVLATGPRGSNDHTSVDWRLPSAFVIGPEAEGLSDDEIETVGRNITIPMTPPVESLNAAVAASIVLYEAFRQRSFGSQADTLLSE
jgi:TrmH family RNA methyltransferase